MATIQNDNANKNALESLNNSFDTELHKNKKYKWYSPRIGNLVIPQVYDDSLSYYEAINKLQMLIHAEIARAITAENLLGANLDKEIQRAKQAESDLNDALNAEIARAKAEEKRLDNKIDAETNRAKAAEKTITDNLNKEIARAKAAEEALTTALNSEIDRAKAAEKKNADAIAAETTRATNAENALGDRITAETTARQNADKTLDDKIAKEVSDRQGADSALDNKITAEEDARKAADNTINQNITNVQNSVNALSGKAVTDVAMTEENGTYTITQEKNGVKSNVGTIDVGANNPVVEVKDSVVENNEKGYDFHTIGETTNDGTENTVGQFYLAQKQITGINYKNSVPTITGIDQNGNEYEQAPVSSFFTLPVTARPNSIVEYDFDYVPSAEDVGAVIYTVNDSSIYVTLGTDKVSLHAAILSFETGKDSIYLLASRRLTGKIQLRRTDSLNNVRTTDISPISYNQPTNDIELRKNECLAVSYGNASQIACLGASGTARFYYIDENTQHYYNLTFIGTAYTATPNAGLTAYYRANEDMTITANTARVTGDHILVLYSGNIPYNASLLLYKGEPPFPYEQL